MTKTYYVWRRDSDRADLNGHVGWTAYPPRDDSICTFTVLFESTDADAARHQWLIARNGDDVITHKLADCHVCWTADPSLVTSAR